jgi:hypothetical protein
MTGPFNGLARRYDDEDYDVFAVMDSVPMVVSGVRSQDSPLLSVISAFFGIDFDTR